MDLERYYGRARYLVSRSGRFGTGPSPAAADTEGRCSHQNQAQACREPDALRRELSLQQHKRKQKDGQQNARCRSIGQSFSKDRCDLIRSRQRS